MLRRAGNDGSVLQLVLLRVDQPDVGLFVSNGRSSGPDGILVRIELEEWSGSAEQAITKDSLEPTSSSSS